MALVVKNLPASAGDVTDVCSTPGQEGPLEEGMATHSSILAQRIPWTEEPGGLYSPWGRKESDTTEATSHARTSSPGNRTSRFSTFRIRVAGRAYKNIGGPAPPSESVIQGPAVRLDKVDF